MASFLITGTSTGIGRATALHLDRLGHRVYAGVRQQTDGEALAAQASDRLRPVILDVTDEASIAAAIVLIDTDLAADGLAGLVNNAGEGFPGPLETIPLDQLRAQFEVNVLGQVAVTRAALPLLRRATGRIVFVSSVGGLVSVAFAGPYHASKYAIEAIGNCWRQELAPEGIVVSLIEPGPIATPIWAKASARLDEQLADPSPLVERYRRRLDAMQDSFRSANEKGSSPDQVAEVIVKALTESRPSSRYAAGRGIKLITPLLPLLPDRLLDRLAALAAK
ncbi:SDR family NAD(P)-dependent oxidoreductase [soil metagenome]